jgi:hypothetical protein
MRVGRSRESGHSVTVMPRTGPLVIAYDASRASKLAIDEAGSLFAGNARSSFTCGRQEPHTPT